MKKMYKLTFCISIIMLTNGCSTAAPANKNTINNDNFNVANNLALNTATFNKLKINAVSSSWRKLDGSRTVGTNRGYLFVSANVSNESNTAIQFNWRCKFYDATNMPVGYDQYDKIATTNTGLGWHSMTAYPNTSADSRGQVENLILCIAPNSLATSFRIEILDNNNNLTSFKG